MEIDILSTIHQYGAVLGCNDLFTDGSVIQEMNPVINALIPSPSIERKIGRPPKVSGSLIARQDSPATHGMEVAFRVEDGHLAGCKDSYDIEMIMLTLAVLIRDQLRDEHPQRHKIFSDCKSAVFKASQVDLARVRGVGHKEYGLLIRRMYHSRSHDTSLLQHVHGHPERRSPKGRRWQDLDGADAGIYLADRIADANMSEIARYLWENDGSVRHPMVTMSASEVLRLLANMDLWSVIRKDGVPIISSPLDNGQRRSLNNWGLTPVQDHPRSYSVGFGNCCWTWTIDTGCGRESCLSRRCKRYFRVSRRKNLTPLVEPLSWTSVS